LELDSSSCQVDAYAVIALLRREAAAEQVAALIRDGGAEIHTLDLAEVIDRMTRLAAADADDVDGPGHGSQSSSLHADGWPAHRCRQADHRQRWDHLPEPRRTHRVAGTYDISTGAIG
jgi:hypothetical protein